jgi:hypothetical protein
MPVKFICKGCGLPTRTNFRLKGSQHYCGDPKCQRARKRAWQKEKIAADAPYREQHLAAQRRWRKHRPVHRYQAQYRQTHPDYVEKNRERQKIRNERRRKLAAGPAPGELIVKMDTLADIKSGTYVLTPYASPKIVKMDAFLVELQLLQADDRPSQAPRL